MKYFPAVSGRCDPVTTGIFTLSDQSLVSAYPFLVGDRNPANFRYFLRVHKNKPVIIDSGAYTLMTQQASKLTPKVVENYFEKYMEFIDKVVDPISPDIPYVEVDCQYLPGGDYLNDQFRDNYPDPSRVYHVWRAVEPREKLIEMSQEYDRVAFAPRDLKAVIKVRSNPGKHKLERIYRATLQGIARELNKEATASHIHVLGSALPELAVMPDNWTCDSSSYTYLNSYGFIFRGSKKWKMDIRPERQEDWVIPKQVMIRVGREYSRIKRIMQAHPQYKTPRERYTKLMACALLCWILWWEDTCLHGYTL